MAFPSPIIEVKERKSRFRLRRVTWIMVALIILGFWIFYTIGGIQACESGGGILLEDGRCVNTSSLDLCKLPDGRMMQYDVGFPEDFYNMTPLNLS